MQIKKIKRSYSKSINTVNYGAPESWVRCEAEFEAEVESNDDPIAVSATLHDAAKKMVINDINVIVSNIRNATLARATGAKPAAPAPAPANFIQPVPANSAPVPAAPAAPSAPVAAAPTYPVTSMPQPTMQPNQGSLLQSNQPPAGIPASPRRL